MHVPGDRPDRKPKQYAPVKFGDPFNPMSVEGHHAALAERRERKREERELAELAEMQQRTRDARPLHRKFWDWLLRR